MENKISTLMLERYRLGELETEERKTVEQALNRDPGLRSRLETLDNSDRELRLRYPAEHFSFEHLSYESLKLPKRRFSASGRLALLAAALVLCILFPVSLFWRNSLGNPPQDRAKGSVLRDIELALYLRGNHEVPLQERAFLHEGDMVQLAYTTPAGEHYGVIFSVDGRFVLTTHYPHQRGQSSLLVSGRHTYLEAAYVLDDAPGFELFIMLVSTEPLDVEAVLLEARLITLRAMSSELLDVMVFIEDEIKAAFRNYEVETLRMLKK